MIAYRTENRPCAEGSSGLQREYNANREIKETVYENIAHGSSVLIIINVTHGLLWDIVCFNFVML
jgi:hypothetical protein